MADGKLVDPRDWAQEIIRGIVRLYGDEESAEEVSKVLQAFNATSNGTFWDNRKAGREETLEDIRKLLTDVGAKVSGGIASAIGSLYGIPAVANSLNAVANGTADNAVRLAAGRAVVEVIFGIFNLQGVASGYLNREPGVEEKENFARFIGMNWQIQMADLIAEMASKWIPWDVAGGVREIGDKVEKLLGLEDAQEEIMEPLMEKLIIEGLNKRFNRETMPTDLSPGDAVQAHIQDLITPLAFKMIMDNEGIRPDIRDALIQLRAKNLSESDYRDLYQRGVWSRDDVFKAYRSNGYLADDAELKTSIIIVDRMWMLRKELWNVKEQQFAHGVLDEAAFRAFLSTMHFSAEEEDIEIEIAKGRASLSTTKKPKVITGTFNVAPWRVKPGASAIMSWNIRNATSITISGVGSVEPRGERVIQPDISQTYVLTASSDTDEERFEAVVQVGDTRELKRPTASFSASPGKITVGTPVELKWATNNAESVSIDQVGPVAESGALPVFPFLSTIYTLRARNAQGETIRQDIVFVELPDLGFGKDQRPGVSFAITPGVVKAKQPRAELTWTLTRASSGTLTFPDGSTKEVGRNGALIFTATTSGIFTLKASNVFGETQNQQAVIFEEAADDEPPPPPGTVPPTVFLSVSPGTAHPGESLFVFWTITGADVGTMVFADGTTRQVGASGNQNVTAPATPGTYEFRLQASNAAGPASQSVILVVSTAG